MVEAGQLHVVAALRPWVFAIGSKMNVCMCLVFGCLPLCVQTFSWQCDIEFACYRWLCLCCVLIHAIICLDFGSWHKVN